MFSELGEEWFDDYWMNYGKITLKTKDGSSEKLADLDSFVTFRNGDTSLIVHKHGSKKRSGQ